MVGGGGGERVVTDYTLSLHLGICHGPVDSLRAIWIGEKEAWSGKVVNQSAFYIDNMNLFGGDSSEGGIRGVVHYLPGGPTQVMPSILAQRWNKTPETSPAFRGLCSIFFVDGFPSGASHGIMQHIPNRGFLWAQNNPYLKDTWVTVTRSPKGLDPGTALVPRITGVGHSINFVLDISGSMRGDRLTTLKNGMRRILDRLKGSISGAKSNLDIGITFFAESAHHISALNATIGDIDRLASSIQSVWIAADNTPHVDGVPLAAGTSYSNAMLSTRDWFLASLSRPAISKRTCVFVTDGEPNPVGNHNTAAAIASDMLSRTGGQFNEGDGTAVDFRAINIDLANTAYSRVLDNTPDDGVPVVSGNDGTSLLNAISNSVFGGEPLDANPSHMIYECLTNVDWGMGANPNSINKASFEYAADILYGEGLGLSMMWAQQATVQEFVNEIIDHIQAVLYTNPRTGKMELKLIRADYDPATLRVLTVSNAKLSNFQRKLWPETTNEIVVSWTNPESESTETVMVQDIGKIAIQGAVVSDSRNYYGVRYCELANRLADRDLATVSAPLATLNVECSREFWDALPSEVVKVTLPEEGLYEAIFRCLGPVNYGKRGSNSIRMPLIEDIFSYSGVVSEPSPGTQWVNPSTLPTPADHSQIFTMPYFFYSQLVGEETIESRYPEVLAAVLAAEPASDGNTFSLHGERTQPNGAVTETTIGSLTFSARATLSESLAAEATSVVPDFPDVVGDWNSIQAGGFAIIAPTGATDETAEIALIESYDEDGWTLKRGALDTVPRDWPAGTPVWFVSGGSKFDDPSRRAAGETVSYKILTNTSLGVLPPEAAPWVSGTLTERPHLPMRPANVKLDGVGFGEVDLRASTTFEITWATRNRLLENTQVVPWDDPDMIPESGQTTTVELCDAAGELIETHANLTGSSLVVDKADFGSVSLGVVRVLSEKGELRSLQAHEFKVRLADAGYGLGYGINYGG